jgi:exopolysaccharide biosynthesis polyprenyl glycosylphosphotransferase
MVSKTILVEQAVNRARSSIANWEAPPPKPVALWRFLSSSRCKVILFLAGDLTAVGTAHWLAETWVKHYLQVPDTFLNPSAYYLFYMPFVAALLFFLEGYKSPDLRRPEKELKLVFTAVSLCFVALACANSVLFKTLSFSRYLIVAWYALTLLGALGIRFSLRSVYDSFWRRGLAQQNALLVGQSSSLSESQQRLSIQRYKGYRFVGILAESNSAQTAIAGTLGLPVLGSLDNWEQIVRSHNIQLIFLSLPPNPHGSHPRSLAILRRCQKLGLDVEVYSELFGCSEFNYERDEFSGFYRFYAAPRGSLAIERFVKTILDRLIGLFGSVITLLLTPVVGLLIKLEDGGPIFYWREFVGCNGEIHYYRKFRTMVQNADQIVRDNPELKAQFNQKHKLKDDPRILRVGRLLRKYSIDEFPQFFSLLTGQLTFVGPRVISSEEKERYGVLLPKLLSVKPGLTGFWQVKGRQTTSYDERVQMDMFYVDHWSIWLDLVIIVKTLWKVARAEGAY